MASTFILKRKIFFTDLGHGMTGQTSKANRAMDFSKKSPEIGKANTNFTSTLKPSVEKTYQNLFKPSTELSYGTTKPVSTGNQSYRFLEGYNKDGSAIWNESAVTNSTPSNVQVKQQQKQIQKQQKQSKKQYQQQLKADKERYAQTIKQTKANLQQQQGMRQAAFKKGANSVGVWGGIKNTWNRPGMGGKAGLIASGAALAGTTYLAGKQLFGNKNN